MSGGDESSRTSVNERLARARAEDLRRQRNAASKQPVDAPASSSHLPAHAAAPSSSSARAGLLFLASTRLASSERAETLRNRQLNRQVAGPIPPASWQNDFERLALRRGTLSHRTSQRTEHIPATHTAQDLRHETCAVFRHFTGPADTSPSLRDMTLCIIADALNQPNDRQHAREVLEYLPAHMHDRLMALCGRLAQTENPLSDSTAQALVELRPSAGDDQELEADWQEGPHYEASYAPTLLDLSFAHPSAQTWRKWTALDSGSSLRALSLAGWTGEPALDSPAVLTALARLRNLETLSLARTALAPDTHARAAILLRKFGRTLAKLHRLDLSYCDWASADALCGVSWAAAFPALRRLVLHGCAAVRDSERDGRVFGADDPPAENYVAPWHARHCQVHTRLEGTAGPPVDDGYDASAGQPRASSFSTYTPGALQPAIVSSVSAAHGDPVLTSFVRCPRSSGQIPLWQWQRVRILDAVRGRTHPSPPHRQWIDVWF